jgi:hypothetical protein
MVKPPITARPSGALWAPPSLSARAIGTIPDTMAIDVIKDWTEPLLCSKECCIQCCFARQAAVLGIVDEQDGVTYSDADRHNRSHKGLDIERGAS